LAPRFAAAAIAAFSTVVKGGLIPHARQGGRSDDGLAIAGSKFDGTGLEKEHIGQIQVALIGLGLGDAAGGANGLDIRGTGEFDGPFEEPEPADKSPSLAGDDPSARLGGLG